MIGFAFDTDVVNGVGLIMVGAGVDLGALARFLAWWMPLNLVLHTAFIILGATKWRLDTTKIPVHHYLTHTLIFLPRLGLAILDVYAKQFGEWLAAAQHKRKTT